MSQNMSKAEFEKVLQKSLMSEVNSDLCHLQHKLIGFFITEMKSVYCAVRTGSLNKAVYAVRTGSLNKAVCASYLKG